MYVQPCNLIYSISLNRKDKKEKLHCAAHLTHKFVCLGQTIIYSLRNGHCKELHFSFLDKFLIFLMNCLTKELNQKGAQGSGMNEVIPA